MSRRIDIEITSTRDDQQFTWRAAGARQPKGTVRIAALPSGTAVGDILKVEIETGLDGSEITQVVPGRTTRHEPERLELVARPPADDDLVTSQLAPKGRSGGKRRERGDRPPRGDRPTRGDRSNRGERTPRGERGSGDARRSDDHAGPRRPRRSPERPTEPPRPKAPRLKAGRTHRKAILETLPAEQRPVAEQVLRGGLAGVRTAIDRDNEQRRSQGQPEVPSAGLIELAESLLPRLRAAEWHDRADAALVAIDELDLRDLRSVAVAADDHAKDETTRALAAELRAKLTERVERAQREWLDDLARALDEKRVVRAIKLSSRPPKAGSPLPSPIADRLVEATNGTLTADAGSSRWVAVIDALAFSPIRGRVQPTDVPAQPGTELIELLTRNATRLPELAARFGIDPTTVPTPTKPNDKRRRRGGKSGGPGSAAPSTPTTPVAVSPTTDSPAPDDASSIAPSGGDATPEPGDATPVAIDETSTSSPIEAESASVEHEVSEGTTESGDVGEAK